MITLIKLLKIVLPVTTVTAATIATVSLVSFQKVDDKLNKESEDRVLEDFEKPTEDFKEKTMLYAKDGQGNNVAVKDEQQKKKLLEELEKNKGNLTQTEKTPSELKDNLSNNASEGSEIESKDVDAKSQIDSSGKSSVEDQTQTMPQIALPLSREPTNDLGTDDSGEAVTQNGIENSEQGSNVQDRVLGQSEISRDSSDNEEGEPKPKSQNSVQDMSKKNSEDGKTDNLTEAKDTLLEKTPNVQERGEDSESNIGSPAKDAHSSESSSDNLIKDGSDSSQGDQNGISNEDGNAPMTPEKLDELIQLGDSASNALNDLRQLLLV